MTGRPWHRLPPEITTDLRVALEGVEDDVLARLAADPLAASALEDPATIDNLRAGLAGAIGRFADEVGRPDAPADRSLFVAHGRLQRAGGRSLEEMLAFYRHSALAIWGRAAGVALARGAPAGTVAALADALFSFVDELATAATLGYDEARGDEDVAADARRRQLLRLILRTPPPDGARLREASAAARWPLPPRIVVATCAAADLAALAAALGRDTLTDVLDGQGIAVAPADRRIADRATTAGVRTGVSEPVTPEDAASARRRAGQLWALAHPEQPAFEADHRASLLILAEPALARALAADRLAPLDSLSGARRERAVETLQAWLDHPGRPQEMARTLHLHVQTVRYRLGALRERFGAALDDPAARFELTLALRADTLAREATTARRPDPSPAPDAGVA